MPKPELETILTPSPDRIPHRCPSFGTCGGCVWQGLDYAVQLEYKTRQVRESLEHLGGLRDFEMLPIVSMADPWRYRNRADFSIGTGDKGAVIGFRPPGRWDSVLPLSECHLLEPGLEQARTTVEAWLRDEGLPGWEPRRGEGFARHLLARSAQGGSELLLSLVTIPGDLPGAARLVDRLRVGPSPTRGSRPCGQRREGRGKQRPGVDDYMGAAPPAREGGRHHPQSVRRRLLPDEHQDDGVAVRPRPPGDRVRRDPPAWRRGRRPGRRRGLGRPGHLGPLLGGGLHRPLACRRRAAQCWGSRPYPRRWRTPARTPARTG